MRLVSLGAGLIKRVLINALITLASLFTSEKVLDRVRFAEIGEVAAHVRSYARLIYLLIIISY